MTEKKCNTCSLITSEEEEEESFQCDLCEMWYHIKCEKVLKKDVKAQKNSSRLRLHCNECEESHEKVFMNKMNLMLQVVLKIDMEIQQRKTVELKNDESITLIANKLRSLEEKVDGKFDELRKNSMSEPSLSKPSFSNVVKNAVRAAVVIKPKNKQHSKVTMQQIENTVEKTQLKVCGTKNIRDGGVVLCCSNKNETMKVKEMVREKLGEDYEVTLPAIKNPRIRITNIDPNIPDNDIISELKLNNEIIRSADMKLITVIPKRIRGTAFNDVVVEVDAEAYKVLLDVGVLYLPWRECRVFEHIYLKRCFKCCGFSHTSNECQNEQSCSKCAGKHKHSLCRSKKTCCINCKQTNERLNIQLDTNHHAWSRSCEVLQRRLQRMREKIEYNINE